ncbi:hypothetical protein BS78_06G177600 [Paspalum vaginatum]|nr:hypothetical protein BS78_06G177600 [Paspalum vaginatum]
MGGGLGKLSSKAVPALARGPPAATNLKLAQVSAQPLKNGWLMTDEVKGVTSLLTRSRPVMSLHYCCRASLACMQEPDPDEELWAMIVEMTQHSSVSSSHPSPPTPAAVPVPVRFYVFLDSLVAPGAGTQQAAARTAPRANQRARRASNPWVPRRRFAALPPLRGFSDLFKFNRKR